MSESRIRYLKLRPVTLIPLSTCRTVFGHDHSNFVDLDIACLFNVMTSVGSRRGSPITEYIHSCFPQPHPQSVNNLITTPDHSPAYSSP